MRLADVVCDAPSSHSLRVDRAEPGLPENGIDRGLARAPTSAPVRHVPKVEWLFWPWPIPGWWNSLTFYGSARPSAVDLTLIKLVYEFMAADVPCSKCAASLGRKVELTPDTSGAVESWSITVITRCSGWRRHQHTATVSESHQELILGPFHR